MDTDRLKRLLAAYEKAPAEFRATNYWQSYERDILDTISRIDVTELQSGKYPVLATFGFGDTIYAYHPASPAWKKGMLRAIHEWVIADRAILPYGMNLRDIREMAYRHCELLADAAGAAPVSRISMSTAGNPGDVFEIGGNQYSVHFLSYYIRYCFFHRHVPLTGNEIVVELGSGSGKQTEVLKKLYPDLTVLSFDLPAQTFLCEAYLSTALPSGTIVGADTTLPWTDLSGLERGKVHFFGNWQMPLLSALKFDVFWNAASFGEMEPAVVKNYLSYVNGNAASVYLLQARHGKETTGRIHVEEKLTFDDYDKLLDGYRLLQQHDAYHAHRRLSDSGGYFEAAWTRIGDATSGGAGAATAQVLR